MCDEYDSDFKEHFEKLRKARRMQPIHFYGVQVAVSKRIGKTIYFKVQNGYRPSALDIQRRFAALLECSVTHFLYPPIKDDWKRPDVQQYIGSLNLLNIDGVICMYRGAEREKGRHAWTPGEIELKIDDQLWDSQ